MNIYSLPLNEDYVKGTVRYPFCCPKEIFSGVGICFNVTGISGFPGYNDVFCLLKPFDSSGEFNGEYIQHNGQSFDLNGNNKIETYFFPRFGINGAIQAGGLVVATGTLPLESEVIYRWVYGSGAPFRELLTFNQSFSMGEEVSKTKASGVLFFGTGVEPRSIRIGDITSIIPPEVYQYNFNNNLSTLISEINNNSLLVNAEPYNFTNTSNTFQRHLSGVVDLRPEGLLFKSINSGLSGNLIKVISNEVQDLFYNDERSYFGEYLDKRPMYFKNRNELLAGGSVVYESGIKKYFDYHTHPAAVSPCPSTGVYIRVMSEGTITGHVKQGWTNLDSEGTCPVEPVVQAACDPVFNYVVTNPERIEYDNQNNATGVVWCRRRKAYLDAQIAPLPYGPKTYFYGQTDHGWTRMTLDYHSMQTADLPGLINKVKIETVIYADLEAGRPPYSGETNYYVDTGDYKVYVQSGFLPPQVVTNPTAFYNLNVNRVTALPIMLGFSNTGITPLGNRIASIDVNLRGLVGKLHRYKKLGGIVYQDLKSLYNNNGGSISGALSTIIGTSSSTTPVFNLREDPDLELKKAYELYWRGIEDPTLPTVINYSPNFVQFDPTKICGFNPEDGGNTGEWCVQGEPVQIRIACRAGIANVEVPEDVWDEACAGCGETEQRTVNAAWGSTRLPKRPKILCFNSPAEPTRPTSVRDRRPSSFTRSQSTPQQTNFTINEKGQFIWR